MYIMVNLVARYRKVLLRTGVVAIGGLELLTGRWMTGSLLDTAGLADAWIVTGGLIAAFDWIRWIKVGTAGMLTLDWDKKAQNCSQLTGHYVIQFAGNKLSIHTRCL